MEAVKVTPSASPEPSPSPPPENPEEMVASVNGELTPLPVVRRFSSAETFPVSPRAGNGPDSLIFMNRNSDFTRTVYEVDNSLLKQIRSSVKRVPTMEALNAAANSPALAERLAPPSAPRTNNGAARSATTLKDLGLKEPPSAIPPAAGEPTMERPPRPLPQKLDFSATTATQATPQKKTTEVSMQEERKKAPPKKKDVDHHLMIKVGILFSRSSGRDKFCALLQYGSMFWGNQKLFAVSQARDAPWRNLEDSMSAGRKTLRLFKWVKEFERLQRAYVTSDPGPHATEERTKVASVLGFLMHTFSFAYYFIDNVLFSSQIGLINRPDVTSIADLRKMLKSGVSHEEYMKLQKKFRMDEEIRARAKHFESNLKDWKNYSSLLRLVFAIMYCSLQIDSATKAQKLVIQDPLNNEKDKRKQHWELHELKIDTYKELTASVCNLIILLNRLNMSIFKRLPLWGVGLLGMAAAALGLDKNWPREKPVF